jgi:hypothetical protein
MHRARASRPRGFDSLPSLDPDRGWGVRIMVLEYKKWRKQMLRVYFV